MTSPYYNTVLQTDIYLLPHQMDNSIRTHIRDNLVKQFEKRCYNRYGYICKIYNITEQSNGVIIPENNNAVAKYNVKFTCKICYPIINTTIVTQIKRYNTAQINSRNGPIIVIISLAEKNSNFAIDSNSGEIYYVNSNVRKKINIDDYITVNIINIEFHHKDEIIRAYGRLVNMATPDEVSKSIYNDDTQIDDSTLVNIDDVLI